MIALLGRRDMPTDGVEDYCVFLAQALKALGVDLKIRRVSWQEKGWLAALRGLRQESPAWKGDWVLLQYTGLGWSKRGFPVGLLGVMRVLRRRQVRFAVVFHEFARQGGTNRWIDRLRGVCQNAVIRRLYRFASVAVFTVPLEMVPWLPVGDAKAKFIPIGANIPAPAVPRESFRDADRKTVVVFGVTEPPGMEGEVKAITGVLREAEKSLTGLRLVVLGRGSSDAGKLLASALRGTSVRLAARGVVPAEDVARELEAADALLFLRGPITPQRGSALAGIASGLPLVGYRNGCVSCLLEEAGVEWAPLGDTAELARGLVRVLTDPQRWSELHERNVRLHRDQFSWIRIATLYQAAFYG